MELLLGQDHLRKTVTTNPQASSWMAFPDFVVGKLGRANVLLIYVLAICYCYVFRCMLFSWQEAPVTAGVTQVLSLSLEDNLVPKVFWLKETFGADDLVRNIPKG